MAPPKLTILHFHKEYPDNEACLARLFADRFPHPKCPKCGRGGDYHKRSDRSSYICNCGKHEIYPKQGTIFEKSDTDLVKWFFSIFLFSQSKNGVAAKEIERSVGVTYKTAWRMAKEIRKLMYDFPEIQSGEIEADETMVGGRRHGKRGRGAEGKTIVFGTLQRKGKLNTAIVPNVKAATLLPHFTDNVAKGSKLLTDELHSYRKIAKLTGMEHDTVQHGAKQYVKGATHTNTIEGFWSQLKRSLDGTHHVISAKYLSSYVSEFQWKWNQRESRTAIFDLLLSRITLPHVAAMSRIGAYQCLLPA